MVDRSDYLCRSWQELYFPKRVVCYVRVIGVHNTMNRSFHLVSFSCYYTFKQFQLGEKKNLLGRASACMHGKLPIIIMCTTDLIIP